jgi:hypothetical protein
MFFHEAEQLFAHSIVKLQRLQEPVRVTRCDSTGAGIEFAMNDPSLLFRDSSYVLMLAHWSSQWLISAFLL